MTSLLSRLSLVQRELRRRNSLYVLLQSAVIFAVLTLGLQAIDLVIPLRESSSFSMITIIVIISIITLILSFIFQVLRQPTSNELAIRIEQKHPELQDSLICAVEKEQLPESELNAIESLLITKVRQRTAELNFGLAAIARRLTNKRLTILAGTAVILCALAINTPIFMKGSFHIREQMGMIKAGIIVTPGATEVPFKSDIEITAKITRWNEAPSIEISDENGSNSYAMTQTGDLYTFTHYDIQGVISYRVTTDSMESDWYEVTTYVPPQIKEFKGIITPPAYTRVKESTFTRLSQQSSVIGSKLSFDLTTTPEGSSAVLVINKRKVPMNAENGRLTGSFELLQDSIVSIELTSPDNRTFKTTPVKLEAQPDLPPLVTIMAPEQDSIVKPDEPAQLVVRAGDDYGLTNLVITYSISGGAPQTVPIQSFGEKHPTTDHEDTYVINPAETGALPGDVISYYFTAKDNMEPLHQKGRSEVGFLEVRKEIKPKKSKGATKKKELDINPIIVELKRLIRLTYDGIDGVPQVRQKIEADLKPALSDLHTEAIKLSESIAEKAGPNVMVFFHQALEYLADAEKKARDSKLREALPLEEKSLAQLTKLAQLLMSNMTSDEPKGEKGKSSDSKGGKKKTQKQMDMNAMLKQLEQLREKMGILSDKQGAMNSSLKNILNQTIPHAEQQELIKKQKQIINTLSGLESMIPDNLKSVLRDVKEANASFSQSQRNVAAGKHSPALRSGTSGRRSLQKAIGTLDRQIKQFIASQIQKMADKAQALGSKHNDLAKQSSSMDGKNPPKNEIDKAKKSQRDTAAEAKQLSKQIEQLSGILEEKYPEASEQLSEAVNALKRKRVQAMMKRAENAMTYKMFKKAAQYQEKVSKELSGFSKKLSDAKNALPKMSQEELHQARKEIMEARKMLADAKKSSAGKEGKAEADAIKKMQKQLSKKLNDVGSKQHSSQLKNLAMALDLLMDSPTLDESISNSDDVLRKASQIINKYLMQNAFKDEISLRRKNYSTPERYRNQIDEYFKALSE